LEAKKVAIPNTFINFQAANGLESDQGTLRRPSQLFGILENHFAPRDGSLRGLKCCTSRVCDMAECRVLHQGAQGLHSRASSVTSH
jgi:hypothetical protein